MLGRLRQHRHRLKLWFGTNMMGVGLHSYGFMDSAVFWLAGFIASQLTIIAIGCLPMRMWRSMEA